MTTTTGPQPSSWLRADWVNLLARLSVGFARAAEAGGSPARAHFAGAIQGDPIPSLEGFARLMVAWGAWLGRADNPVVVRYGHRDVDLLATAVSGLADGSNPDGPWWWGPIGDRDQRIVEAAELAVGLWLGRDRLVPGLGADRLARLLDWLGGVDGQAVYDDNWVLFPAIVATVRRSLGVAVPDRAIDDGLDVMVAHYRGDGWYADGAGEAFDLYTGWAIHWHLLLWAAIDGDRRPHLRQLVQARARVFLSDHLALAGADGAIPLFGRSLAYRFAEAAPLGLAAILGILDLDPGQVRRRMSRSISHYLDHDAIDPATDWFRIGVHGQRPDVCERYISYGSVAWAAHALLPLALGPDHPFWTVDESALPVERADGERVLRGPGILIGWRHSTGDSWFISARGDHPHDIPGHDYRTAYGKAIYQSAFPFNVSAGDGAPGPDSAILLDCEGETGHRDATLAGGVGPGWSWTRYRVTTGLRQHGVTSAAIRVGEAWLRVTGVQPGGSVRVIEGSAALGAPDLSRISRRSDPAAGLELATDGPRSVAIRRLLGYDSQAASAPFRGPTDINLVAAHAEQPTVFEAWPSPRKRVLAALTVARRGSLTADLDLPEFKVESPDPASAIAWGPAGEIAFFAVGGRGRRACTLGGWSIGGPGLRIVRIGPNGDWLSGEAIGWVAGVVQLERAGPIHLRRQADGSVELGITGGVVLDAGWTGQPMQQLLIRVGDGWTPVNRLDVPGVVPGQLVRSLARRTGHEFVHLRLEA